MVAVDEDTYSESSTLTADTEGSGSNGNGSTTKRRGRHHNQHHHVRFNPNQTIKYSRPPLEEKELQRRWYSSRDTDEMKERSFAQAREMRKYDQKSRGNNNFHAMLGKLLDACLKAKEDTGKTLLKKKDFCRLGRMHGIVCGTLGFGIGNSNRYHGG